MLKIDQSFVQDLGRAVHRPQSVNLRHDLGSRSSRLDPAPDIEADPGRIVDGPGQVVVIPLVIHPVVTHEASIQQLPDDLPLGVVNQGAVDVEGDEGDPLGAWGGVRVHRCSALPAPAGRRAPCPGRSAIE